MTTRRIRSTVSRAADGARVYTAPATLATSPAPAACICGGCYRTIAAGAESLVWSSLGMSVRYCGAACRARVSL